MKRLALLVVAVGWVIAACSSSKLPGGTGGTANGGSGGTASGGTAGTASGGSGGSASCATAECLRPYECVRSCDGPIEYSGCCACQAPLFDNYQQLACGARGGTAGAGGVAGGGGNAGTTGAAGRGGTTGAAGAGGRGGTSGSAGAGGGTAGAGGRACEANLCLRPFVCRRSCGGPVESNG